jgi:hypothetical protein
MDSVDNSKNLLKHVFNFDDDSKSDMMNIIQYSLVALLPVVILNKTMSKYVPEADETKGSLEVSAEILIQVILMFIGLLLIHRLVTFVPTYSGEKYPEFNIVFVILAVLMITLSLQTKLGEKVGILFDRVTELWEGKKQAQPKQGSNVRVSQPISGQQQITQQQSNQTYNDGTSINSLPTMEQQIAAQPMPNYDAMYKKDPTPLVNAASPSMEPIAANESFGGFSNW